MESFFQNLGDNKPAHYWSGTSLWCRSEMHSLILALTWNVKLVNIERQLTHMLFANFHERVCQRLDIEKQFQWAKEGVYMLTQTMASEKPFLPRLSCFLMTQGTSLVNLFLDLKRISNKIERTCLDVVQGGWKYTPLRQPTAQQVVLNMISSGPITVFIMWSHTKFAVFLMNNPHLEKNVEHIYVMGGDIRSDCSSSDNSFLSRVM